jgi:hypothetical protein
MQASPLDVINIGAQLAAINSTWYQGGVNWWVSVLKHTILREVREATTKSACGTSPLCLYIISYIPHRLLL